MAVILVGLIGSSMYVTEKTGYVKYDAESDTASEPFVIQDFELRYTGNNIDPQANNDDIMYTVTFDVYKTGEFVGAVSPTVQFVQSTQQQKLVASVISFPTEDLFVVYRGVNEDGDFSMDVRVNPLISEVWIGFGLLMAGILVATLGRRGAKRKLSEGEEDKIELAEKGVDRVKEDVEKLGEDAGEDVVENAGAVENAAEEIL